MVKRVQCQITLKQCDIEGINATICSEIQNNSYLVP